MKLEGITLVIVTILVVVTITVLLSLYSRRQLAKEWTGKVEKIKHYTRTDNRQGHGIAAQSHHICIVCRKMDGGKVNVRMEKGAFDKWYPDGLQVGEILHKKAGGWYPVVLPEERKE